MKKITKEEKEFITICSAMGMLLFGCAMVVAAFLIEPVGQVSESILWVFGQSLIYAGGALGIANYAKQSARDAVREFEEERKKVNIVEDSQDADS